jgi:hypothetical protein
MMQRIPLDLNRMLSADGNFYRVVQENEGIKPTIGDLHRKICGYLTRPCEYYNSVNGCTRGSRCHFDHNYQGTISPDIIAAYRKVHDTIIVGAAKPIDKVITEEALVESHTQICTLKNELSALQLSERIIMQNKIDMEGILVESQTRICTLEYELSELHNYIKEHKSSETNLLQSKVDIEGVLLKYQVRIRVLEDDADDDHIYIQKQNHRLSEALEHITSLEDQIKTKDLLQKVLLDQIAQSHQYDSSELPEHKRVRY